MQCPIYRRNISLYEKQKKTIGTYIQRPEFYLNNLLRLSFNSCFSEGSIVFNAQLKIVVQRKLKILPCN